MSSPRSLPRQNSPDPESVARIRPREPSRSRASPTWPGHGRWPFTHWRRRARLAAEDEDIPLSGDRRSGPQDVLELLASHLRALRSRSRNAPRTARRSASVSTPAKGEFWRNSIASGVCEVNVCRTASGPAPRTACHSSSQRALIPEGCTWRSRPRLVRARSRVPVGSVARCPATAPWSHRDWR